MGHGERTASMLPRGAVVHRQGQDQEIIFGKMVDALSQEATRVSSADRNPSRYDRVHVLLMRWEHDDLGVAPEVDALATVFDRDFGFEVSQLTIPVDNSIYRLNRALLDWVEAYDHDGVLLILYYAGHGQISDWGRTLMWCNRRCEDDENYRELRWNGCEDILLQAAADKLFIFDCCYAANAVSTGGRGVSEVICASGFESIAPLPGPHSFTTALISVLQRMVQLTRPFSVSAIYSGVLSHLKALDPSQITPDGFRIANALDYANALPGLRRPEFRRTPVHFVRTNRHHHHQSFSIQLFPLPRTKTNDFYVVHEEPRVPKPEMRPTHRAFTVEVHPTSDLCYTDADITRRWLRSIPIPVQDISVKITSPGPPPKPGSPFLEKGGHVKIPPGFDLTETTHNIERMAYLHEEMVKIARASEGEAASMKAIAVLTMVFLPGTFIATMLGTTATLEFKTDAFNGVGELSGKIKSFGLRTFLLAATPLMLSTVSIWWGLSIVLHRRRLRERYRAAE